MPHEHPVYLPGATRAPNPSAQGHIPEKHHLEEQRNMGGGVCCFPCVKENPRVSSLGALLVTLGSLKTLKNSWFFFKAKKEKVNFSVYVKYN